MINPIIIQLVARAQTTDLLKQAEQIRLIKATAIIQPASRFDLRAALRNFMSSVRYQFKVPAHAK